MLVVVWFGFAFLVGVLAAKKDRSGLGWFLIACVISPLIAGILLLLAGAGNTMRCPHCAETIKQAAKICPYCRSDLVPPKIAKEEQIVRYDPPEKPLTNWRQTAD